MSDQNRSAFFWLVVLACCVYAGFFAFGVYVSVRYHCVIKEGGWTIRYRGGSAYVSTVAERGAAAGRLEAGDRLLAINGDERRGVIGIYNWREVDGGKPYRVDVERAGVRRSVDLTMRLIPGRQLWPVFQFCGLAFFLCGAVLALLRPTDGQVRLVGAALMAAGFASLHEALQAPYPFLIGWEQKMHFGEVPFALWAFPLAYHFFSRFPLGRSPGTMWRAIQWLLYGSLIVGVLPAWLTFWVALGVFEPATRFLVAHPVLFATAYAVGGAPNLVYQGLCLTLAVIVAVRNYRQLRDADSRRRIRWVIAAMAIGIVPFVVWTLASRVMGWIGQDVYAFFSPITFLSMLCIPASIAMAVWKDQLFDIRVLVRRGLQYLFARAALRTLLALPVVGLALSIVRHPDRTIGQFLTQGSGWINVALVGAIALALQSRQRLQATLDRRFFREAYEQEQVLTRLIAEVSERDSLADVAAIVSARLDSVLHPASLHIFYRTRESSERFDGHSSSGMVTGAQLGAQQALLRLLDQEKTIRDIPGNVERALPDHERQWLASLGVKLIVPIAGSRHQLVGVLLLGERKSEEPYSATDRRLLQGLATQIGLVYENQHLHDRIRQDADVRRDVLARLDAHSISLMKECSACGRCFDGTSDRCDRDGAELRLTMPIERTLDGKYRLERAIGRGGFGAVYEASDLRLQRQVAAKVLMGSLFGDRTALRRFEREARAAAKIDHPNITRVHDYGSIGSGGAFLIMELVSGHTWRTELQRSGIIAPARASEWFRQLLAGLHFAHAMGIVHRDLKPENVMIVPPKPEDVHRAEVDAVKIMDFGLARVLETGMGATESVTIAGTALGTIGYMAPETLTGGLVDERTDIFAIGVMVVETLTGTRPFTGQTAEQILASLLRDAYHLPGESTNARALDAIVQRCLAKDPRDRYGSAAELANELVPALAREGSAVRAADRTQHKVEGSTITRPERV